MPITRIFRLGTPYHWRAMKPARSGKSDASKLGTVHAGAACSEDGCQITAAAPRAIDIRPAIRSLHRIRQIRIAWLDRPAIRMQIGRAGHMLAEPCQRMLNGARPYS